jgi:Zn-dependent protease with chaperone function
VLTTLRAAVALVLLAGFYLFAGALVAGMVLLGLALKSPKLFLVALIVAGGILVAFWKVIRTKPELPNGVRVEPAQAPQLWATVRDLANKVGTRAPDEIQLVAEVNAAVVENTRWLGLIGGRRFLLVGTPLVQTFTVDQLRAVLAHELGHYSHSHTRLGALTYRGRLSILHTLSQLDGLVVLLMSFYARLYFLVESAVSRRQEFEADLASARIAGKAAAASALREMPVLGSAWGFYLNSYVGWGLDSGYAPTNILAGFPKLWRARTTEIDDMRRNPVPDERSRWDSHPPVAARVAVIERQPDVAVQADGRPAVDLVPGFDGLLEGVERSEFQFGARRLVSMAEFTSLAAQANLQDSADLLYRAAGRVTGSPMPGLGTVLEIVQSGRHGELARSMVGADFADSVKAAISTAAVRSGVAHWEMSWTDVARLIDREGEQFPVQKLAEPLIAGDAQGSSAALDSLAALGVDLGNAQVVEARASADRSEVIGAMVNMVIDGKRRDLLVLDTGLIVVPGSARLKISRAKRRLAELAGQPPAQLIAHPQFRYLPYEEMTRVVARRRLRRTYELTMHNGALVRIRHGGESEDLGDTGAFARVMAHLLNR